MTREDAYMLISAAVDLVITQVVDGPKGVHVIMPKNLFVTTAPAHTGR